MSLQNTVAQTSNETCKAKRFEHRIEKLGRQTTHYIKTDSAQFYFVRRPGQTDDQMRELGEWIAQTLNFRIEMDTEPLPELLQ